MGESEVERAKIKRNGGRKVFGPSIFVQLLGKLQNNFKLNRHGKRNGRENYLRIKNGSSVALGVNLERQLQAWRANPFWTDQPPQIKVSVPKGSLCNLSVAFDVGLPPDAVYDIVTDPDNRRVFKNIKEVISRRVLLDEGQRQVVEVEQAALWKFLWWSGTISVHVLVDQNRQDFSMKFKQMKTGFMKRFEGNWKVEPVFVDEAICYPLKPKTWEEYESCTDGKGRVGCKVSLEQLIEPALVPPPPISWYLRGITSKTTEMIATDLIAEAARIRGDFTVGKPQDQSLCDKKENDKPLDIKERWSRQKRSVRKHRGKFGQM